MVAVEITVVVFAGLFDFPLTGFPRLGGQSRLLPGFPLVMGPSHPFVKTIFVQLTKKRGIFVVLELSW